MSKPLGPGDRAIVVRAVNPENLGKLVHLVSIVPPGGLPSFDPPDGARWVPDHSTELLECESLGSDFVIRSAQGRQWRTRLAVFHPRQLKRLDDDFDQDITTNEREKEVA